MSLIDIQEKPKGEHSLISVSSQEFLGLKTTSNSWFQFHSCLSSRFLQVKWIHAFFKSISVKGTLTTLAC